MRWSRGARARGRLGLAGRVNRGAAVVPAQAHALDRGAFVADRHRRSRRRLVAGIVVLAALVAGAIAVRAGGESDSTPVVNQPPALTPGQWTPIPDGPLVHRSGAVAFTVGDEAFVVGGRYHANCPAGGDCAADHDLTNGAAYNLDTGRWRSIADAPMPIVGASTAVIATATPQNRL